MVNNKQFTHVDAEVKEINQLQDVRGRGLMIGLDLEMKERSIKEETEIGTVRLNRADDMLNVNGKILWFTGNSVKQQLRLNMLDCSEYVTHPTTLLPTSPYPSPKQTPKQKKRF